jgi:hypothetical protein
VSTLLSGIQYILVWSLKALRQPRGSQEVS